MRRLLPLASLAAALFVSCGGDPAANPCATNPCLNGGTCTNNAGVAACACASGFSGTLCADVVVNPCSPNPCLNGGTCSVVSANTKCGCAAGFAGATCAQHAAAVTTVTPPGTAASGTAATFTATVSDQDSLVTAVSWDFGDGGTKSDTAFTRSGATLTSTVQHTYTAGGSVTVGVSVTGGGVTSSKTASLTVTGAAATCTTTSWNVTAPGLEYDFSGVAGANPAITVCKGQKFTFHLQNVPSNHPFCIWNAGDQNSAPGVTNNCATGTADVVWDVPANLATGARYICDVHFFGNSFTIQ
jgi:hypothetical protein